MCVYLTVALTTGAGHMAWMLKLVSPGAIGVLGLITVTTGMPSSSKILTESFTFRANVNLVSRLNCPRLDETTCQVVSPGDLAPYEMQLHMDDYSL